MELLSGNCEDACCAAGVTAGVLQRVKRGVDERVGLNSTAFGREGTLPFVTFQGEGFR